MAARRKAVRSSKAAAADAGLREVLEAFRDCRPLFQALGEPARQDIIMLLAEHERLNVTALAERLPLSRPAISHHLKVLKSAGLVAMARESRENHYSLELDSALERLQNLVEVAGSSCT